MAFLLYVVATWPYLSLVLAPLLDVFFDEKELTKSTFMLSGLLFYVVPSIAIGALVHNNWEHLFVACVCFLSYGYLILAMWFWMPHVAMILMAIALVLFVALTLLSVAGGGFGLLCTFLTPLESGATVFSVFAVGPAIAFVYLLAIAAVEVMETGLPRDARAVLEANDGSFVISWWMAAACTALPALTHISLTLYLRKICQFFRSKTTIAAIDAYLIFLAGMFIAVVGVGIFLTQQSEQAWQALLVIPFALANIFQFLWFVHLISYIPDMIRLEE